MKRIKTKLLIVLLLALGVFAYHSYTSIGDSDVKNEAQSMVEKKLGNASVIEFSDVDIVQKSEFKEGESYRVCGLYRLSSQDSSLPFVANVSIKEGRFSEHGQLIISETPELQFSIEQLCVKKTTN
ncbi:MULTISPECIES: hypothetical protein [Providencia]|uniref:DUF1310 family protein n=1 Tax=Providencia rettgeri TaxID=587 RepID=A0AB35L6K6_PRORE|nr:MULTISPECIES: hypothetical protein [Providencia]EHZ7766185.1 hypothetical protein [Providencia rettgeri]EIJ7169327.1 hypothetical protein [Providencia rettgeri]EJD6047265.1 hypothetical protein [Providencia rettgeri]EJD6474625.1 hypothetical protein [Providencia rettgeri]EKT57060.1 hypothetical protein OOC_12666 [Providencia rettgeri Dmel1]